MARRRSLARGHQGAAGQLELLVARAMEIAKKARKQRKSLAGTNYYADKLAGLRADATNEFRSFSSSGVGDVSALAEMIEVVFSGQASPKQLAEVARELVFSLRTTWRESSASAGDTKPEDIFPLGLLTQVGRGYLVTVGRQMNGCFSAGWHDASLVMMRRLLELCLIEAFEACGAGDKIKDEEGNYLQLSDLVGQALAGSAIKLSRNSRRFLPQLRDLGHASAHGRYFSARREDVEAIRVPCRLVIEELLHHGKLL